MFRQGETHHVSSIVHSGFHVSSIVFMIKLLSLSIPHPLATPIVLFMFPIQDRTGKVCFGANVNWM